MRHNPLTPQKKKRFKCTSTKNKCNQNSIVYTGTRFLEGGASQTSRRHSTVQRRTRSLVSAVSLQQGTDASNRYWGTSFSLPLALSLFVCSLSRRQHAVGPMDGGSEHAPGPATQEVETLAPQRSPLDSFEARGAPAAVPEHCSHLPHPPNPFGQRSQRAISAHERSFDGCSQPTLTAKKVFDTERVPLVSPRSRSAVCSLLLQAQRVRRLCRGCFDDPSIMLHAPGDGGRQSGLEQVPITVDSDPPISARFVFPGRFRRSCDAPSRHRHVKKTSCCARRSPSPRADRR